VTSASSRRRFAPRLIPAFGESGSAGPLAHRASLALWTLSSSVLYVRSRRSRQGERSGNAHDCAGGTAQVGGEREKVSRLCAS